MLLHVQCRGNVPLAHARLAACYDELLALAQLRSAHFQAHGLAVVAAFRPLNFVAHDAVCDGRCVEVGIIRNVEPMVIDHIAHCF